MAETQQRTLFGEYCFQISPALIFEKEANEQWGECLFVFDPQEKYVFSFESGMPCFDLMFREKPEYCSEEFLCGQSKVSLCYPKIYRKICGCMVYFHAELYDAQGAIHMLPGQLAIAAGGEWSEESKTILMELLGCIEVNDRKQAS